MTKTMTTKLDATRKWVGEFNAIPQQFILRAFPDGLEDLEILSTELECANCESTDYSSEGGTPELITCTECEGSCEVDGNKCDECAGTGLVSDPDEEVEDVRTCLSCGSNEFQNAYGFPMWGTMWTFGSNLDEDWVRDHGGLEAMRECGLWVYDDEDLGIFFGIDGAGYDFYEQHWIPLYEKRGLKWHTVTLNELI